MKCRYTLEDGQPIVRSTGISYHPEIIEFSETVEGEENLILYRLDKKDDNKIKLTIDYNIENSFLSRLKFRLKYKGKLEERYKRSVVNLEKALVVDN
jgi:hypothetical protein